MFKVFTSVLNPKSKPTKLELHKISSFMFCRWLSFNPRTILASNQINYYYNIPVENQYELIKKAFAGKIKYIQFPKKVSNEAHKSVEYLQEHFKITEEKAKEYLEEIDKDELKMIVNAYSERDLKR